MLEAIIGLAILFIILVTDIVFALDAKDGNTYSEMITLLSQKYILIPLWGGIIAGHWFVTLGVNRPKGGLFILIGMSLVLLAIEIATKHFLATNTHSTHWMLFGIALGSIFWSQG